MSALRFLFLLLFLFFLLPTYCQESDPAGDNTPDNSYRAGRWITGISGTINSSNLGRGFSERDTSSFSNGHLVNLQVGYLIKDQFPVGLFVSSRSQSSFERFERDSENLSIGLWSRYYFIPGNASLYPELALFYTHFFNRNLLISETTTGIDTSIDGDGYGAALGLGFSYVLEDVLVFDIGLNYNFFRIRGDLIDKIQETATKKSFSAQEVNFSFGFKVLIRK